MNRVCIHVQSVYSNIIGTIMIIDQSDQSMRCFTVQAHTFVNMQNTFIIDKNQQMKLNSV